MLYLLWIGLDWIGLDWVGLARMRINEVREQGRTSRQG